MRKPIRLQAVLTFAKPPRRLRPKQRPPDARDLFGAVVVTQADVAAWLRAVPGLNIDQPRAAAYIVNYNVVGKIIEAKRRGEFARLVAANDPAA